VSTLSAKDLSSIVKKREKSADLDDTEPSVKTGNKLGK